MPYKRANFTHFRQLKPSLFKPGTYYTTPLTNTKYRGKKFKGRDAKARVALLKSTGKPAIQSILVPFNKSKGLLGGTRTGRL